MKNKAFTLAEVLVTLMIIGVIASITIPTLKKTSDEKAYVAGALKAYSELSAATKSLKRTEGPIPMWSLYATGDPVVDIMNKYKKIMPSVGVPPKSYTIQTLNNEATDYGNKFSNSKATITASSVNENEILLCIQRNILNLNKKLIEPQEINIYTKTQNKHIEMAVFCIMLLYGMILE